MTPEEFREAFLEAQNGLGNDLQALANLSKALVDLTSRLSTTVGTIQTDYVKMNEAVAKFLNEQDS